MRIEFFYKPDDFQEMRRLLSQSEPQQQKWMRVVGWVFFISLAVALFMFLNGKQNLNTPRPAPVPMPAPVRSLLLFWITMLIACLMLAGLIYLTFILPRRLYGRTVLAADPELQLAQIIEITDDGVSKSTTASQTSWQWETFNEVLENQNILVLKRPPLGFLVIPKRAIPQAELASLTTMLRSRIQPQTGAFPVTPIQPPGQ